MRKIIFLVDMNAFFISCEMARNPELKGKPAAVAGNPRSRHGIILAANYDARKYNVKTTLVVHEARKLCPQLILVPPDRDLYSTKSKEVMSILSRYSPVIEQNSIDEAWMDLTGCEALFGKPLDIAKRIMDDIRSELDLWCSIGISDNKFLAKMASEMKKPLGITEIYAKDVKDKIWPLPVRDMYGIGKQTEKRLINLAVNTIGDLAKFDRSLLKKLFGKYGDELHCLANGIDTSPVMEQPEYTGKSIGRSTTLAKDTTDLEYAKTVLLRLAEEVGTEARKFGSKGKTVSITIKYGDFQSITRQKTVPPTYLTRDIYKCGICLLQENWNIHRPVRLLGIGISSFSDSGISEQLTLFDLVDNDKANEREENLERAIDAIRTKHGHDKVSRAKLLRGK